MAGRNYYLLSFLPGLDDLGSAPPMSPSEMLGCVGESDQTLKELLEILFLSDDIMQYQAVQAGEIEEPVTTVLTSMQINGQEPLPEWLLVESHESRSTYDRGWENFFYFADRLARRSGSVFLQRWVAFEVSLRNALVEARAKALNLEATEYVIAADLTGDVDLTAIINEWTAAANPMQGLRVLDEARWNWIAQNERYFSFDNDELLAWATRLMLLQRWHRLGAKGQAAPAGA